jgi:hypothetical protein
MWRPKIPSTSENFQIIQMSGLPPFISLVLLYLSSYLNTLLILIFVYLCHHVASQHCLNIKKFSNPSQSPPRCEITTLSPCTWEDEEGEVFPVKLCDRYISDRSESGRSTSITMIRCLQWLRRHSGHLEIPIDMGLDAHKAHTCDPVRE